MARQRIDGLPLNQLLPRYVDVLAEGWKAWIEHFEQTYFGEGYSRIRRADFLMQALSAAAGRWALDTNASPARRSPTKQILLMRAIDATGRDGVASSVLDALTCSMQQAFRSIADDIAGEPGVRAALVPLQLSAMRSGAVLAFKTLLDPEVVATTLDLYLLEQLPPGAGWFKN